MRGGNVKTVLFVDDEIQILKTFRRIFINTEFNIITASSGLEALEILKKNSVDLVISDMKMPQMDGYEFLNIVKELYPNITRIILSGYSDQETVYKSLLKNTAKLYLFKPWDNDLLIETIRNTFYLRDEMDKFLIDSKLFLEDNLPVNLDLFDKLNTMILQNENIEKISHLLNQDPSITLRILRIANSAYYGLHTSSISHAISYIGLNYVKYIVLSSTLIGKMKLKKETEHYLDILIEHLSLTNKIVTYVYKKFLNKKLTVDSSNAGLMHDIGIIVLFILYPDKMDEVYKNEVHFCDDKEQMNFERESFGFNHCELGSFLLDWWGLPMSVVEVARYHHSPFEENIIHSELAKVVYLADYYSWKKIGKDIQYELDNKIFEDLNISKIEFEAQINELTVGGQNE
jgi:response regulator RpfG family c-di-GMP phosphodiesterase